MKYGICLIFLFAVSATHGMQPSADFNQSCLEASVLINIIYTVCKKRLPSIRLPQKQNNTEKISPEKIIQKEEH